ncbi:MAG: hypothetical protein WDZ54_14500 [Sneathiella sp.]
MWKISYLLLGTILLGNLFPGQAEAREDRKYSYESKDYKHHNAKSRGKGDHNKYYGRDQVKFRDHLKASRPVKKDHSNYRGKQKSNQASKVYYATSNPKKVKNVYYAKPAPKRVPNVHYVKPRVKPYYNSYRPKYVYVKPYHTSHYHGHYPYRGFYWPFINVQFVINLTGRQLEMHHQAIYAALDAPVGKKIRWRDGVQSGRIDILRQGFDDRGNLCKQYRQILYYRNHSASSIMTSCLSSDGYWISV